MSDTTEAPDTSAAPEPTTTPSTTGANSPRDPDSMQARIDAAAEMMGKVGGPEPESTDDAEPESEPAEAEASEAPKPTKAEGKKSAKAKSEGDAEQKGDESSKPRNMMRDLASEWANARRAQKENQKRAHELAERQSQLEAEAAQAREVAMLMQGHPIKAVEKLAAIAGIRPSEYLARLQQAYIEGDEPASRQGGQADAVARELAQLRAELQAEKQARAEQEQRAQYQQQFEQVKTSETSTLVELAKHYSSEFPALGRIPESTLQSRVADAVDFYLQQGHEVGRFEVLQALNNIIDGDLQALGLGDTVEARASASPAATGGKPSNGDGQPRTSRNGSSRHIPTNRDAAGSGGARRAMTMEERLREAEKVLTQAARR